jgi:hypothetical protein
MDPNNGRKDSWWKRIMMVSLLPRKGKNNEKRKVD